jgi:hypothetical protein
MSETGVIANCPKCKGKLEHGLYEVFEGYVQWPVDCEACDFSGVYFEVTKPGGLEDHEGNPIEYYEQDEEGHVLTVPAIRQKEVI